MICTYRTTLFHPNRLASKSRAGLASLLLFLLFRTLIVGKFPPSQNRFGCLGNLYNQYWCDCQCFARTSFIPKSSRDILTLFNKNCSSVFDDNIHPWIYWHVSHVGCILYDPLFSLYWLMSKHLINPGFRWIVITLKIVFMACHSY